MSNGGAAFLLFLVLSLALCAELESGSKKRGDITQKSNSNEETDEEVAEDLETAFEQIRELTALRDTIMKMVPTSDPLYEKINKQVGRKEAESKTESQASKETLESPGPRSVWMKTMIAETKDTDPLVIGRQLDNEDIESWDNRELLERLLNEEEVQEPLSPEQQTGRSKAKCVACFC